MKECNILGSGPSKVSYIPNDLPTIGCNFPWISVDYTIISDVEPLIKMIEFKEEFPTKYIILHDKLYTHIQRIGLYNDLIKSKLIGIFSSPIPATQMFRGNSGHHAAQWMISQGFNKLNLYGMDNYFGDIMCLNNFSHDIASPYMFPNNSLVLFSKDQLYQRGIDWKNQWQRIINYNPNVEFNFIK